MGKHGEKIHLAIDISGYPDTYCGMSEIELVSKVFSEVLRLRLMMLLWGSSICVKCLAQTLNVPQSTISRHLAVLRNIGIVRSERKDKHVYYKIDIKGKHAMLKQDLLAVYQRELIAMEPYRSDMKALLKQSHFCGSGCVIGRKLYKSNTSAGSPSRSGAGN